MQAHVATLEKILASEKFKRLPGDIMEIRGDKLTERHLDKLIEVAAKPLLVKYTKLPSESLLEKMYKKKIFALDLDVHFAEKIKFPKKSHAKRPKIIISEHATHAKYTHKTLMAKIEKMRLLGADISKLVMLYSKKHEEDQLKLMAHLLRTMREPLILHATGEGSELARLETAKLGSYIMYVAVSPTEKTAKGQWTIPEWMRYTGIHEPEYRHCRPPKRGKINPLQRTRKK